MEYIQINDSKLKIICDKEDLYPYGISADALEYGDADTRKFLEDIFEHAKTALGFETKHHRILVQLYPSSDGGCEIFIHRLGALNKEPDENEKTKKQSAPKKCEKIFFFNKLDSLLEVCNRLSIKDFDGKSAVYYVADKGYFLSIELFCDLDEYKIFMLDEYSFILEYGEPENAALHLPYLKEHAKCLCRENAVETLGKI